MKSDPVNSSVRIGPKKEGRRGQYLYGYDTVYGTKVLLASASTDFYVCDVQDLVYRW